ncbi:MAG: DUF6165 family protein [Gammaproteobacteria bacterium]|nr:DUF6165 family protein [Gammaproteobacteria bacterium]
MLQLYAPLSVGELIDKITILKIKQKKATDTQKLININRELDELESTWKKEKAAELDISDLFQQLTEVNEALWNIEDDIRAKEAVNKFDQEFIDLARSVYKQNDRRAALKKEINIRSGSTLIEEKLYQEY